MGRGRRRFFSTHDWCFLRVLIRVRSLAFGTVFFCNTPRTGCSAATGCVFALELSASESKDDNDCWCLIFFVMGFVCREIMVSGVDRFDCCFFYFLCLATR